MHDHRYLMCSTTLDGYGMIMKPLILKCILFKNNSNNEMLFWRKISITIFELFIKSFRISIVCLEMYIFMTNEFRREIQVCNHCEWEGWIVIRFQFVIIERYLILMKIGRDEGESEWVEEKAKKTRVMRKKIVKSKNEKIRRRIVKSGVSLDLKLEDKYSWNSSVV